MKKPRTSYPLIPILFPSYFFFVSAFFSTPESIFQRRMPIKFRVCLFFHHAFSLSIRSSHCNAISPSVFLPRQNRSAIFHTLRLLAGNIQAREGSLTNPTKFSSILTFENIRLYQNVTISNCSLFFSYPNTSISIFGRSKICQRKRHGLQLRK